jgi:SPP1 family predicted phage head-tail adaptor
MPSLKSSIGNNKFISLDDVCNLISLSSTQDELGQPIITEKPMMVFCSKLSITRHEFGVAGQQGHKPEMMLVVDADTYENEKKVEYQNKKFDIYKTFHRSDGFIELYCEVVAHDRNQ